jgi:hypothetical protein
VVKYSIIIFLVDGQGHVRTPQSTKESEHQQTPIGTVTLFHSVLDGTDFGLTGIDRIFGSFWFPMILWYLQISFSQEQDDYFQISQLYQRKSTPTALGCL